MEGGPYHVRVLVLWRDQVLLVQHHDRRRGTSFWMPPGGGSEPGETIEAAAVREVKEETGLDVRVLRQVAVPAERGYMCVLAELVGPDTITPELEEPFDGIYTTAAAWHPVSLDAPLAAMEPEYWAELTEVIRDELRRGPRHMTLYRPTGLDELARIYDAAMRAFPPRLEGQPIFYPVTNQEYADEIARSWNASGPNGAGYVTRFEVEAEYVSRFDRHVVGAARHEELWVPAAELEEFNAHLLGPIELEAAFFSEAYRGLIPTALLLKDRSADEQLATLAELLELYPMDFHIELRTNHKAVWINYAYWSSPACVSPPAQRENTLEAIRSDWPAEAVPLPQLGSR